MGLGIVGGVGRQIIVEARLGAKITGFAVAQRGMTMVIAIEAVVKNVVIVTGVVTIGGTVCGGADGVVEGERR